MVFLDAFQERIVEVAHMAGSSSGILVAAAAIYLLVSRGLAAIETRKHLPPRLIQTFRRIARWTVGVAAGVLVLQSVGVLHSVFAAITGVLALVAIGFVAVWSVLSNTLCSLILMIVRPFRVGDTLRLPPDDFQGTVVNFNLLFTTLATDDDQTLQVPNNLFFQRPVLRKKGTANVLLSDQLYRARNLDVAPPSETIRAAA